MPGGAASIPPGGQPHGAARVCYSRRSPGDDRCWTRCRSLGRCRAADGLVWLAAGSSARLALGCIRRWATRRGRAWRLELDEAPPFAPFRLVRCAGRRMGSRPCEVSRRSRGEEQGRVLWATGLDGRLTTLHLSLEPFERAAAEAKAALFRAGELPLAELARRGPGASRAVTRARPTSPSRRKRGRSLARDLPADDRRVGGGPPSAVHDAHVALGAMSADPAPRPTRSRRWGTSSAATGRSR